MEYGDVINKSLSKQKTIVRIRKMEEVPGIGYSTGSTFITVIIHTSMA